LTSLSRNPPEGSSTKEYGSEDQVLITSVDRIHLQRAIDSLPPGYRAFFVLRDIEGYEYHKIAEVTPFAESSILSELPYLPQLTCG
jgi:RNA polymerase sigma-70 factor (ECF subfamily)